MECKEYYDSIKEAVREAYELTFTDPAQTIFSKTHNQLLLLESLREKVANRPDVILFDAALSEFQYSLQHASNGLYRYAFISLRMFLELGLSSIHFSGNEFALRLWINGEEDINWNAIVDHDRGVFSIKFARSFCEGVDQEMSSYRTLATTLYRECSEFVHGNYKTQTESLRQIKFNDTHLRTWASRTETAVLLVTFAFSVRFLKQLNLPERLSLHDPLVEMFPGMPGIRALIES